jgi:hypothetical protein
VIDLEGWGGWLPGFTAYFDQMAEDWRGWDGARDWRDDQGGVMLSATHNRMDLIQLTVLLRPFYGADGPDTWELRVVIPIEPGAMTDIARKAHLLVGSPSQPEQPR